MLTNYDVNAFFLQKVDSHEELERITPSTKTKLLSQVFHMVQEADLVNTSKQIIRVIPSRRLAIALKPDADFAYQIYPAFPEEFEIYDEQSLQSKYCQPFRPPLQGHVQPSIPADARTKQRNPFFIFPFNPQEQNDIEKWVKR